MHGYHQSTPLRGQVIRGSQPIQFALPSEFNSQIDKASNNSDGADYFR
jgi:hypothetical protein